MRTKALFVLLAAAATLLAGCGQEQKPEDWEMSPDSLGPITVTTTKGEALQTGAFRRIPSPCTDFGLAWHTQTYRSTRDDEDHDGKVDQVVTGRALPSLTYRSDKKAGFEFIDPGQHTTTTRGINRGDSFKALKAAYGKDWIGQAGSNGTSGAYAVNGTRSYLLFAVADSKVDSFFIARGMVKGPNDFLVGRGGLC